MNSPRKGIPESKHRGATDPLTIEIDTPRSRWFWIKRLLLFGGIVFALLLAAIVARSAYAFRDRNPGYAFTINIDGAKARANPRPLRVGFARQKINPDLSDPNRPVWLAGFSQHRAATKIHDDLWAVACVIDDGYTRLGVVALDAIGFFHDDVIAVRRRLSPDLKLDYTIICATHNHSTPDLMGLWGKDFFHTGVDGLYREQVIAAAAKVLADAAASLQPGRLALHEIPMPTAGLVADTRKPEVFDPDLRVMQFLSPTTGATLGSIVGWSDHPETPWGHNTEITSDFCGALRESMENGVTIGGQRFASGVGGTHLFVNGAIGGLISTTPSVTVRDPFSQTEFKEPSHEKSGAVGHQLASRILPRLAGTNALASDCAAISIRARTVEVPVDNLAFLAAPVIGLLNRGQPHWKHIRTEVALVTIGDASIACIPGEIYPEIVNGGIERAPGGDFDCEPVEVPPIRTLMPGKVKFVFGLANDEIGYLIPKSEWDRKPPYLHGAKHGVYGEINSAGPDAAATIHAAIRELTRANKVRTNAFEK